MSTHSPMDGTRPPGGLSNSRSKQARTEGGLHPHDEGSDVSAKLPRIGRVSAFRRAFAMFFATSLAARGIGIVCQLVQVPLVVHALGAEAFGLWVTLTSLTNLVLFADLGLGLGAQNQLAENFARKEYAQARVLFGSVLVFMGGLAIALAGVLLLIVHRLDFGALFHLHDTATVSQAPGAALALCWVFCAGFPFGLAQRLAFARHEGWMFNITQAAGSVASLALVFLGTRLHWSLAALIGASQGAMLFGNVALLGVQLVRLEWLDVRRFTFDRTAVRQLLRVGAFFGVQQVLTTLMFALPQLIISTVLGAAAVTPFNLAQRLFNLFAVVQNAFMLPLWPAYAEAKARREFDRMRTMLRRSLHATVACCVLPMTTSAIFAPQIIDLWVRHGSAQPSASVLWLLFAWTALTFLQQPFGYLLAGVSEVKRATLYSVFSAALSVTLMTALVRPFGVPGVIAGLIAGFLPFNFAGVVFEAKRYLRTSETLPEPAPALAA